jgi:hypothetical protein
MKDDDSATLDRPPRHPKFDAGVVSPLLARRAERKKENTVAAPAQIINNNISLDSFAEVFRPLTTLMAPTATSIPVSKTDNPNPTPALVAYNHLPAGHKPGAEISLVEFCATSNPKLGDTVLNKLKQHELIDVCDLLYMEDLGVLGLAAGELARMKRALHNWSLPLTSLTN